MPTIWTNFIKEFSLKHGLKYACALSKYKEPLKKAYKLFKEGKKWYEPINEIGVGGRLIGGNKWTDFVKDFAKKYNTTYGCSLSDEKIKNAYKLFKEGKEWYTEPKKRRGRPTIEGSIRQTKLLAMKSDEIPKLKPRGRPKKVEPIEPIPIAKVGRPGKCDSVKPKSDVVMPLTHKRPIINWFEIEGARNLGLKSNQQVSEKLLHYNKLTPEAFFDVLDVTIPSVELGYEIRTFYDKDTTRQKLYVNFRKIVSYLVAKGLTTANKLEHALVTRISGDLVEKPKELKNFMGFVKKHCIDRSQIDIIKPKKAIIKKIKSKVFPLDKLVPFSETKYDFTKKNYMDIIRNTFKDKQANIKKIGDNKFERVEKELLDDDEDEATGPNMWEAVPIMISNYIVNNLLEQVREEKPDLYETLNQQYEDDKPSIIAEVRSWLQTL